MTKDRELLELAAKAAGIDCKGWVMPGGRSDGWHGMYTGSDEDGSYLRWNPLTDDGDALRLALKLGIDFKIKSGATWWDRQPRDGLVQSIGHEPHNDDPFAATRRAIVRAAAEIGKEMS